MEVAADTVVGLVLTTDRRGAAVDGDAPQVLAPAALRARASGPFPPPGPASYLIVGSFLSKFLSLSPQKLRTPAGNCSLSRVFSIRLI